MSYQAVVRDAGNALVTSTVVGMQISILQTTATGTAVYVETQTPTSNANGLVSLEIGSGTVVSGTFNTIDWSNGLYFIKTETDPAGGSSYTITGTSQLMSVPYALHAKTADSIIGGVSFTEVDGSITSEIQDLQLVGNNLTITDNGSATTIDLSAYLDNTDTQLDSTDIANLGYVAGVTQVTEGTNVTITGAGTTASPYVVNATSGSSGHYIGELFGGGIVFYVYNNGANGLIASLDDLDGGSGVAWSATQSVIVPNGATDMTDGVANTAAIVAQDATTGYAATLCNVYTGGGFSDWYLPSNRELHLLASQDILIDQILDNDGNGSTNGFSQEYIAPTYGIYWSST